MEVKLKGKENAKIVDLDQGQEIKPMIRKGKVVVRVMLNGTKENPWHKLGLTQNPFPQLGKYEYERDCLIVQSLGGDPIPSTDYIKERLKGFSSEFINLCCSQFKPGEMVEFDVEWEE